MESVALKLNTKYGSHTSPLVLSTDIYERIYLLKVLWLLLTVPTVW